MNMLLRFAIAFVPCLLLLGCTHHTRQGSINTNSKQTCAIFERTLWDEIKSEEIETLLSEQAKSKYKDKGANLSGKIKSFMINMVKEREECLSYAKINMPSMTIDINDIYTSSRPLNYRITIDGVELTFEISIASTLLDTDMRKNENGQVCTLGHISHSISFSGNLTGAFAITKYYDFTPKMGNKGGCS